LKKRKFGFVCSNVEKEDFGFDFNAVDTKIWPEKLLN
jgi:hypothetical protein